MAKRPPTEEEFAAEMKRRRETKTEPAKTEPAKTEPAKTEPAKTEPESRAERADRETYIRRGQEAWKRHKADATWLDWMSIGEAITIGRHEAMMEAGKNRPEGSAYNKAFGAWLKAHAFDDLDPSDRKRLLDCCDHRVAIEQWRATKLTGPQRRKLNHPSSVWRRWKADTEMPAEKKAKAEKKQARIDKQKEEGNLHAGKSNSELVDELEAAEAHAADLEAARDNGALTVDQHLKAIVASVHDDKDRLDVITRLGKLLNLDVVIERFAKATDKAKKTKAKAKSKAKPKSKK
jgi:hypothetical protein